VWFDVGFRRTLWKIFALASFLGAREGSRLILEQELRLTTDGWSSERLDDLASRARAWLEAQGEGHGS
jgi:hypothetical protein